jgi:hypothetical protein
MPHSKIIENKKKWESINPLFTFISKYFL